MHVLWKELLRTTWEGASCKSMPLLTWQENRSCCEASSRAKLITKSKISVRVLDLQNWGKLFRCHGNATLQNVPEKSFVSGQTAQLDNGKQVQMSIGQSFLTPENTPSLLYGKWNATVTLQTWACGPFFFRSKSVRHVLFFKSKRVAGRHAFCMLARTLNLMIPSILYSSSLGCTSGHIRIRWSYKVWSRAVMINRLIDVLHRFEKFSINRFMFLPIDNRLMHDRLPIAWLRL